MAFRMVVARKPLSLQASNKGPYQSYLRDQAGGFYGRRPLLNRALYARMRQQAFEQGFDDFRLVVVNPPHETIVEIPGLDNLLVAAIAEQHSSELDDLIGVVRVEGVDNLDIDAIEITTDGIYVVGSGTLRVGIEHDDGEVYNGLDVETDFPFTFDVILSHALRIERMRSFRVDTSSFDE